MHSAKFWLLYVIIFSRHLWILCLLVLIGCAHAGFSTVVIDAGHGGHDVGGVPGQRWCEKELALDLARRLRSYLNEAGLKTVMTRSSDTFVSLPERVAIANRQKNAVMVSIHFNSARRVGAHGFEIFYFKGKTACSLAQAIHAKLSKVVPFDDRGVKSRRFYVIRKTKIPSVLVEAGFLTNPREGAMCAKAEYRQKLARAIASAVIAKK